MSKICIKARAYEPQILDKAVERIVKAILSSGPEIRISGPIPLPNKRKVVTVLKSPFVYKDANDQFEQITHTRLVYIHNLNAKAISVLEKLELPNAVGIKIKT